MPDFSPPEETTSTTPETTSTAPERPAIHIPDHKLTSLEKTNADEVIGAIEYDRAKFEAKAQLNHTRYKGLRGLFDRLIHRREYQQQLDTEIQEILDNRQLISETELAFIQGVFEQNAEHDQHNRQQITAMLDNRPWLEKIRNSERVQRALETTVLGISVGSVIGIVNTIARSEGRHLAKLAVGVTGGGALAGGALGGYVAWQKAVREQYRASSHHLTRDLYETMRSQNSYENKLAAIQAFEDLIRTKISAGNVVEAILLQSKVSQKKHELVEIQAQLRPADEVGVENIENNPTLSEKAKAIYDKLKHDKQRKVLKATLAGAVLGAVVGGGIGFAAAEIGQTIHETGYQTISDSTTIPPADLEAARNQVTEAFYNVQPDPATHVQEALNVQPEVVAEHNWNLFDKETTRIQTRVADLLNQDHSLQFNAGEIHSAQDALREVQQLRDYIAYHPLESGANPRDMQDVSELVRKLGLIENAVKSEIKPTTWSQYGKWIVGGLAAASLGLSGLAAAYLRSRTKRPIAKAGQMTAKTAFFAAEPPAPSVTEKTVAEAEQTVTAELPTKTVVTPPEILGQATHKQETEEQETERREVISRIKRLRDIYSTEKVNQLSPEEQQKLQNEIDQIMKWFSDKLLRSSDFGEEMNKIYKLIGSSMEYKLIADFFDQHIATPLAPRPETQEPAPAPTSDSAPEGEGQPAEQQPQPVESISTIELPETETRFKLEVGIASIPKKERLFHNQDSYICKPETGWMGVFDGMGGHDSAEKSATRASQLVEAYLAATDASGCQSITEVRQYLEQALRSASRTIREEGIAEKDEKNRGTTASVALIWNQPGSKEAYAVIGHVGDSRVYIWHSAEKTLEDITLDDGLGRFEAEERNGKLEFIKSRPAPEVEARRIQRKLSHIQTAADVAQLSPKEKRVWEERHGLYQYIGDVDISPQLYDRLLTEGDILIVTSDGVHDNLSDLFIEKVINQSVTEKRSPQEIAENLATRAYNLSTEKLLEDKTRQKPDDITIVLARFDGIKTIDESAEHPEPEMKLTANELETAHIAFNHVNILYELFTKTNLDTAEEAGRDRRIKELHQLLVTSSQREEMLKVVKQLANSHNPKMVEFIEKQIQPKL